MTQSNIAAGAMIPGAIDALPGEIELNAGRKTVTVSVANGGDRPVQVGSHYHFFETNDALQFERALAYGFRLNIPAGTAVRFEPGQSRQVELVALAGDRIVYGFAGKVMGALDRPKTGLKAKPKAKPPKAGAAKAAAPNTGAKASTSKQTGTKKTAARKTAARKVAAEKAAAGKAKRAVRARRTK